MKVKLYHARRFMHFSPVKHLPKPKEQIFNANGSFWESSYES